MEVDWSRIESLADLDDPEDKAWLQEMLESLCLDFESKIKEIAEIVDSKNLKDLQSIMHQIKGVSANFGLTKIQKCAADSEMAAKSGNLDVAISEAQKISSLWNLANKELQTKFS
jgi:HPt (histidine-containing phosphotransfer) domain-containing protein